MVEIIVEGILLPKNNHKVEHIFHEIPKPKYPKLSAGSKCREIMKEICSLSYLLDENDLESMKMQLRDVLNFASKYVTKDNGLVVESNEPKSKKVCNKQNTPLNNFFNIIT